MKKLIFSTAIAVLIAAAFTNCNKSARDQADATTLSDDEKALVKSAGFNNNWAEKTADGSYLIEGDILLTRDQLQELAGVGTPNELIVANEEHYRTTNVVSTPGS